MTKKVFPKTAVRQMADEGLTSKSNKEELIRRFAKLVGLSEKDSKWHLPGIRAGLERLEAGQPL